MCLENMPILLLQKVPSEEVRSRWIELDAVVIYEVSIIRSPSWTLQLSERSCHQAPRWIAMLIGWNWPGWFPHTKQASALRKWGHLRLRSYECLNIWENSRVRMSKSSGKRAKWTFLRCQSRTWQRYLPWEHRGKRSQCTVLANKR